MTSGAGFGVLGAHVGHALARQHAGPETRPSDLPDRQAFFGFLIGKGTATGHFESSPLDLKPLEEMIASFRIKKPPAEIHPDTCGRWTSI